MALDFCGQAQLCVEASGLDAGQEESLAFLRHPRGFFSMRLEKDTSLAHRPFKMDGFGSGLREDEPLFVCLFVCSVHSLAGGDLRWRWHVSVYTRVTSRFSVVPLSCFIISVLSTGVSE